MSLTDPPQVVDCSIIPVFQVPNEGDVSSLDVNDEENVVSEEKRRKKKKKQVSAPRPACSWVYFSREFIKEYSASHPESSGLKAATKAASDAWKLMSIEEKEKYTRRAREVWDNYLSTTPARIPKPRKQTKLVTRCSPGRLFNVLQRLSSEQKDAVKSMGFGSLLGLRCRTLRRSLCLWLLERFNTTRCSLEICGECIPLSPRDVEHVMGLAACGKDVVNSGPDDLIADLRYIYNATNRGISVRLLEERLAAPEAGDDFKRSFILYALGTLLSPTARLDVSPSFLHFLINMDAVHQYNWGKFLLDRLVREVSRFRQGKQRAVGGCLLFLQLFYYESISIEGAGSSAPVVIPCLSSWGEEEITEREKRERELGGYGCGEVISREGCHDMESLEYRIQVEGLSGGKMSMGVEHNPVFEQERTQADEEQMNEDFSMEEICVVNFPKSKGIMCGDMEEIVEPDGRPCCNKEYGCSKTVDYTRKNDHEEKCTHAPCACPLPACNFVGSSEQLSLHFSSKHWDSGRRFRYNTPLSVSLGMNEQFLVLQAEEDGILFLLNKSVENIGNIAMITCIAPSSSKVYYLYDLVSGKGMSSLRLKSLTLNFPGRVEGFPPMDFLLIPFRFLGPSGEINLEVCIWNSTELGSDCP
ncbi:hypothetical protein ERO13_D06G186000v2 [Gossypium hirsutum]|uniref:Uncharacterized protein isoform X1 n=1 Tax=Gossypium hirsutum TaxID=3635 RepID=A0A1U8PSS7_GOSHI|nr:uncharacterized protein LOC107962374 isoform X1 [Gossypium hirsutum]KAG4143403.1 hypothetical protein ERO13_D06G186000v2 [Gossypium hirsutum]